MTQPPILPVEGRKVRLVVRGDPVQQGSLTGRPVGGHVKIYADNEKKLRPWREQIAGVGAQAMRSDDGWGFKPPLDGALRVRITFTIARPKTVTRRWPSVPPDLDKLLRAVFDALKTGEKRKQDGPVWADDARVVRVEATKLYVGELGALDTPGVSIEVTEIG